MFNYALELLMPLERTDRALEALEGLLGGCVPSNAKRETLKEQGLPLLKLFREEAQRVRERKEAQENALSPHVSLLLPFDEATERYLKVRGGEVVQHEGRACVGVSFWLSLYQGQRYSKLQLTAQGKSESYVLQDSAASLERLYAFQQAASIPLGLLDYTELGLPLVVLGKLDSYVPFESYTRPQGELPRYLWQRADGGGYDVDAEVAAKLSAKLERLSEQQRSHLPTLP